MQSSVPVRPVLVSPSELPNLDFLRVIAVLSFYVAHGEKPRLDIGKAETALAQL
jgi:hypothetical protein